MESWLLEVDRWVANPSDCPTLSYDERSKSHPELNCLGYSLGAGKNVQPGEIALRRHLKYLNGDDANTAKDSFNAHLLVRHALRRDTFEEDIHEALTDDGLLKVESEDDLLIEGLYPVALFFTQPLGSSRIDFHFLRLNSNENWSWIGGQGMPIEIQALNPDTLENERVKNPFQMKWPTHHSPDSIWLAPKGGYDALLMSNGARPSLPEREDNADLIV